MTYRREVDPPERIVQTEPGSAYKPAPGFFTPEPHVLFPGQYVKSVGEMQPPGEVPADILYVSTEYVRIDDGGRMWLYQYAPAYTDDELVMAHINYDADDEPAPLYARVIRVNEGLIFDLSHIDQTGWENLSERYVKIGAEDIQERPQDYVPIIYLATNAAELDEIIPALEANNIDLRDVDSIDDILNDAIALINDIRYLTEEGGDDDEPDDEPDDDAGVTT